ncbi:MAG: VWA domain-containing protein [Thermoanaerobaculia bacterium]
MRRLIAASAVLWASALTAQVNESIDVRVVNVDVTVMSRKGPVRGLTRDDFEIREDGKVQTITNFYTSDETRPTVAVTAAAASSPAAAPVAPQDERFRRKVLVLVENHHTTRRARDTSLRALEAMINDRFHGDYEWSIGVIGRGVTLVLPLSSDKAAIHEALEIIRKIGTGEEGTSSFAGAMDRQGSTPANPDVQKTSWAVFDKDFSSRLSQAGANDDAERVIAAKFTVPAILDSVRGFASTAGRKIVLLLTGDPGLNDVEIVMQGGGNGFNVRGFDRQGERLWANQRAIEDLRTRIIQEANASDVSFYIWNVQGLTAPGGMGAGGLPVTNTSAAFWLSNQTGGRLITGNDQVRALQEFDTTSSSFYSLGYTPAHPDDGRYHSISVSMKRKGDYSLAYRAGYSANPTSTQLARAMQSPTAAAMQASALPVTLALGEPQTDRGTVVTLPIEVKVPFRALQFLPSTHGVAANVVVYVSVFAETGRNLVATAIPLAPAFKSGAPDLDGMLVYRNAIKLRANERQRIVVAVRDAITESIGMATEVVKF